MAARNYTRLDENGLLYLLQLLKTQIQSAGEENVIEVIKKNGVTLSVNNKTVNIEVPTTADIQALITAYGYQTASDVDAKIESAVVGALKFKGTIAFANLPALTAANKDNMYNISDSFTTTADFVEGAGKSYPAGSNVAIVNVGDDANPVYKYDVLVGPIDLSNYVQDSEMHALTNAEIDTIFNEVFTS